VVALNKQCFGCLVSKPRNEFYRHARMADGLLGKCKTCLRADSAARRWGNIDAVRAFDRSRQRPPVNRESQRAFYARHPLARRCHLRVQRALKAGVLTKQPCSVCGSPKSEAHHPDYRRPLDVIWLCCSHHRQWHRDNGPGAPF